MLGLSTTYFAIRQKGIFDSVAAVNELGFGIAELGATHFFEKNIPETLRKIKKDFPKMHFTLHGMFPPLEKKHWFNPAEGLTVLNKKIIEAFFSSAVIVEATLVSFHPGFSQTAAWDKKAVGLNNPLFGKEIPRKKGIENSLEVFSFAQKLSEKTGIAFAVENTSTRPENRPLYVCREDFLGLFEKCPNCGLLLDYGHALFSDNFAELLSLKEKIKQMHLHYNHSLDSGKEEDSHLPFTKIQQLEPLHSIKQLKKIPLIFEHGLDTAVEEILPEKKLVESFLSENF